MIVRRKARWPHALPGPGAGGWLPAGAAPPPARPDRTVEVEVLVEADPGGGAHVSQRALDGSFAWDSWHASVVEAVAEAEATFGLGPADWDEVR